MYCISSDLLVSTTCPTQLECWHAMAFPAGTTAHSQSFLPDTDFLLCPAPVPAPAHTAVIISGSPGPALTGAHHGKRLAGISFLPEQPCCEGVPSLGFAYLLISSNCKVGNAPLSPMGIAQLCPQAGGCFLPQAVVFCFF